MAHPDSQEDAHSTSSAAKVRNSTGVHYCDPRKRKTGCLFQSAFDVSPRFNQGDDCLVNSARKADPRMNDLLQISVTRRQVETVRAPTMQR